MVNVCTGVAIVKILFYKSSCMAFNYSYQWIYKYKDRLRDFSLALCVYTARLPRSTNFQYYFLFLSLCSLLLFLCLYVCSFLLTMTCNAHVLSMIRHKFFLIYFITVCLTLRRLMSYIYGAPILDVSRSHTTTQHSR